MSAFVELFIDAGSDFLTTISVADESTGEALDLTTYNVTSQIRRSYYSRNPSANFNCSLVDATMGNVSLDLVGTISANMKPGFYVFDVMGELDGTHNRFVEGIITITPGVTR